MLKVIYNVKYKSDDELKDEIMKQIAEVLKFILKYSIIRENVRKTAAC